MTTQVITIRFEGQNAERVKGMFDDISNKAEKTGGALSKVGQIAGGFLAAGAIAKGASMLTDFLGKSVTAASDLGESINAINVTFGESSDVIHEFGKTAATEIGLSARAFNQLATPLGAILKNAGIPLDTVAEKTINLTKRAADMASVFNTDVSDALEAINSGLRGEGNPLERYGVGLSAAAVEARALAETGKTVASSLTNEEKALARINIIMEQTDNLTGDFKNTSDGLANSQRIAAARTEELQAKIGEKLVPVMLKITELKLKLVDALVTHVIPALEALYAKHWPAVSKAITDIAAVVQQYWPQIQAVIGFAIDYIISRIQGFIQVIQGVVQVVKGVIDLVSALFHGDWAAAWEAMKSIASGALDIFLGAFKAAFGNIPNIVWNAFNGLLDSAVRELTIGVNKIISLINNAIRAYNSLPLAGDIAEIGSLYVPYDIQGGGGYGPGDIEGEFAHGSPFIPRDMVASIHRGEAIIPAAENPFANGGSMGGTQPTVNFNGPVTIQAQDMANAERGASDMAFGLSLAMRKRGN